MRVIRRRGLGSASVLVAVAACVTSGPEVDLASQELNELFRYRARAIQLALDVKRLGTGDLPALATFQKGLDRTYQARVAQLGEGNESERRRLEDRHDALISEVERQSNATQRLIGSGEDHYDQITAGYNPGITVLQSSLSAAADLDDYRPALQAALQRTGIAVHLFESFHESKIQRRQRLTQVPPEQVLVDEQQPAFRPPVAAKPAAVEVALSHAVERLIDAVIEFRERNDGKDAASREKLRADLEAQRLPPFDLVRPDTDR